MCLNCRAGNTLAYTIIDSVFNFLPGVLWIGRFAWAACQAARNISVVSIKYVP